MSWIDDILDVGSSVWSALTGPGVGAGIARATALGFLLKEVTDSINKDNQKPTAAGDNKPDYGVREQVDPDTEHAVPVIYGQAYIGGIVTDAELVNDNQTMWYCLVICEKTGNLINGTPSVISFEKIYWNESEIVFQSDGITAASLRDEEGNSSTAINGLVKIYCFNNGRTGQTYPLGFSGALQNAENIWAGGGRWTSNNTMENLVFALIRVDYSKANDITGLGDIQFKINNSMTLAGDVLNDYMTNTRYGAGIDAEEIKAS